MRHLMLVGTTAATLCAIGLAVAGLTGAVVVSVIVTVVVALVVRLSAAGRPLEMHEANEERTPTAFPSYRHIRAMLQWTATNGHYYDTVTRPFLVAVAAAVLEDRHRCDIERDPIRSEELLGAEVWGLLKPSVPRSREQPVELERVNMILERLATL